MLSWSLPWCWLWHPGQTPPTMKELSQRSAHPSKLQQPEQPHLGAGEPPTFSPQSGAEFKLSFLLSLGWAVWVPCLPLTLGLHPKIGSPCSRTELLAHLPWQSNLFLLVLGPLSAGRPAFVSLYLCLMFFINGRADLVSP